MTARVIQLNGNSLNPLKINAFVLLFEWAFACIVAIADPLSNQQISERVGAHRVTQTRALCLVSMSVLCFALVECTQAPSLTSIQVTPDSPALTIAGQMIQFKAVGSYNRAGDHPTSLRDITGQVVWASSNTSVSTINASGMATAVNSGAATITATVGGIVGTANVSVAENAVRALTSVAVIPTSQTVTTVGEPSQFIAIGTFTTSPITLDLTSQVSWQSSDVKVATVNANGLAIGNGLGETTITAIGNDPSGAMVPGTATLTFTTPASGAPVTLPVLTIYEVGQGTGTVTDNNGVINCSGIGGPGCTGNYPSNTTVTLTAAPAPGSTFGGWSSNCAVGPPTTCTIVIANNEPVGAIFNH